MSPSAGESKLGRHTHLFLTQAAVPNAGLAVRFRDAASWRAARLSGEVRTAAGLGGGVRTWHQPCLWLFMALLAKAWLDVTKRMRWRQLRLNRGDCVMRITSVLTLLLAWVIASAQQPESAQRAVENGLLKAVQFGASDKRAYSIQERMKHYGVPGVSVAVVDDGRLDWAAGYGTTVAGGQEVTSSTLFQAASIAKPFVAVAAMRMRDEAIIDLDASIQDYLTDYVLPAGKQTMANPVTFRNLLSHTSGVTPGGYPGYARGERLPTDLQILRGQRPANTSAIGVPTAPGTTVAYSGGGYTLVEVAMQNIFDVPFEQVMSEWVLSPLGLQRSTYEQPLRVDLEPNAAYGHLRNGTAVPGGWRNHPEQAAAGLWSTAGDIARLAIAIRSAYQTGSAFLSGSAARELLTEQLDGEAIGLIVQGDQNTRSFSHAGGNQGYRAFMIMYLSSGDGAVVMVNSDAGWNLLQEVLRAVSDRYAWPDYKPQVVEVYDADPGSLERFTGVYEFDAGNGLKITDEISLDPSSGEFAITFPNGDRYVLTAVGPRDFIHPETGVTVSFDRRPGSEDLIVYGQRGSRIGAR